MRDYTPRDAAACCTPKKSSQKLPRPFLPYPFPKSRGTRGGGRGRNQTSSSNAATRATTTTSSNTASSSSRLGVLGVLVVAAGIVRAGVRAQGGGWGAVRLSEGQVSSTPSGLRSFSHSYSSVTCVTSSTRGFFLVLI